MAHDVFVSYSSKDKPTADAVCATLEQRGFRCWIAPRDILPSEDWGGSIIRAINASKVFVLVFSGHANTSVQIKREVERAVNRGIPIIPFRIENVPPGETLEYFINTPHWLDAYTPPLEQHLIYLSRVIEQILDPTTGITSGPKTTPKQSAIPAQRQFVVAAKASKSIEEIISLFPNSVLLLPKTSWLFLIGTPIGIFVLFFIVIAIGEQFSMFSDESISLKIAGVIFLLCIIGYVGMMIVYLRIRYLTKGLLLDSKGVSWSKRFKYLPRFVYPKPRDAFDVMKFGGFDTDGPNSTANLVKRWTLMAEEKRRADLGIELIE